MPAAASAGALRTSADVGPTSPSGAKSTESSKEIIARSNGAPIDFSFRELKVPTDLLFETPVSGQPAHPAIAPGSVVNEYLDSLAASTSGSPDSPQAAAASPSKAHGSTNSTALRLCNNQLTTLKQLDKVALHLFDDPTEVNWIDVSCNRLTSIEEVVTKFPRLQVLYAHGNQIASLQDITVLSKLEHLQKLTLHGAPVAEKKDYKLTVCALLPQLRSLDFSTITKLDRDKIATFVAQKGHLRALRSAAAAANAAAPRE